MILNENRCQTIKSNGEQCKAVKVEGMNHCIFHNGLKGKGVSHSGYVHGGYSNLMPHRMASAMKKASFDPVAISVRAEQDLISSRIAHILDKINDLPSESTLSAIDGKWRGLYDGLVLGKGVDELMDKAESFNSLMTHNMNLFQAWGELYKAVELKRKLVDQEVRITKMKKQNLTIDEVRLLLDNILNAVRDEIRARTNAMLTHEVISDIFMRIEERIRFVLQRS